MKHSVAFIVSAFCLVIADREDLLAQNAPATPTPPAPPKWSASAAAGLTLTRGNSDTLLFTANFLASRKWERNELDFGADATYGEQEDIKNNEAVHGFGQYNRLFTDRFSGYVRLDALHDAIADVDYGVTFGPGVGYYLINNERAFLRTEMGCGVVFEKQGGEEKTYATLRPAERLEHKLTPTAKLWQSVEILPEIGIGRITL